MQTFYKVFFIILLALIAVNLYAIRWDLGAFDPSNNRNWYSIGAGVVGLLLTVVLNMWSQLTVKKR
ncbi:MAG: hypothetical protein EAS48_06865 [Chryseobacterium sp.]|nr:MAG: hypothetical protein EAS48_06865 [Chryseobacterium sp.]